MPTKNKKNDGVIARLSLLISNVIQMSILSAAPRNGESGRGRGRPPCKTARAKKRPARKRSSNRPDEAHASHSSSTFRKSGKKNLKTWSNELMNFGFSD